MIEVLVRTDMKVRCQPQNVFNDVDRHLCRKGSQIYLCTSVCACILCLASYLFTILPMGPTVLDTPPKVTRESPTKKHATTSKDQTDLSI